MKKLVALVLALVMTLSLCSVALATDSTPIDEIDLNSFKIGEGWADKTVKEVADEIIGQKIGDAEVKVIYFSNDNDDDFGDDDDDDTFEAGKEYCFDIRLVTENGYFKHKTSIYAGEMFDGEIKGITDDAPYTSVADWNYQSDCMNSSCNVADTLRIMAYFTINSDDTSFNWDTLAKGAAIAAGITVVTVGTIHTVKAIKNYKAEKAAAAEAAKLAEMPMVAIGSSGEAVTTLQTELNAQGYDCGEVDGIFGQNTLNAVIAFQTANGLAADGIVGELTWGALL